ncbi:MAG: hypothetical protein ACYDBQ_02710 [Thermoplasmatota archaeon]
MRVPAGKGQAAPWGGLAAVCVLALLPAAAALPLEDASRSPGVVGMTWAHLPGNQFQAVLRTTTNATVDYQVCLVGGACIIPPRTAAPVAGGWGFDTTSFHSPSTGRNYPWPAGARIGVAWFLNRTGQPTERVPAAVNESSAACIANWGACMESEYLAFSLPAAQTAAAPGLPFVLAALAANFYAALRSRTLP